MVQLINYSPTFRDLMRDHFTTSGSQDIAASSFAVEPLGITIG